MTLASTAQTEHIHLSRSHSLFLYFVLHVEGKHFLIIFVFIAQDILSFEQFGCS